MASLLNMFTAEPWRRSDGLLRGHDMLLSMLKLLESLWEPEAFVGEFGLLASRSKSVGSTEPGLMTSLFAQDRNVRRVELMQRPCRRGQCWGSDVEEGEFLDGCESSRDARTTV